MILAVLTETSMLPLLWAAWRGREVNLLDVNAHLPWFEPLLQRAMRWMVGKGLVQRAHERFPCIEHMYTVPSYVGQTDMFLTIEPWLNAYYGFADLDRSEPSYSGPIKQAMWLDMERLCNTAYSLNVLRENGLWEGTQFLGVTAEMADLIAAWGGHRPAGAPARSNVLLRLLVNLPLLAALLFYAIAWTLARIRFGNIEAERFLLGSTLALDRRLFKNLADIPDRRNQVCIIYVLRQHADFAKKNLDSKGFVFRHIGEGRLSPRQTMRWLPSVLGDTVRLGTRLLRRRPAMFFQAVKLAHYRMIYRALFNRIRFSSFWGRDDHDQTHQIRTQELRRLGDVSMGINHGVPVSDILQPGNRYIDFDHYYVFGRAFYERHYASFWPKHMKVTAIGSFGLSRDELNRIAVPRTKDIAMFVNPTLDNGHIVDTAMALAQAFPDRRVFFKIKQAPNDILFVDAINARHPLPPNLEVVQKGSEATYDMLMWCGYGISNISTTGCECVHFGVRTFILDTQQPQHPLYYREFDRLTFRNADEVIARIRDLEAGRDEYPWSAYDGLADPSGQDPFDRVRADMGLPPKSPGGMIEALRRTREVRVGTGESYRRKAV